MKTYDTQPEDNRQWYVQDCGTVGVTNAVWLYCEHIEARDSMRPGSTAYLDFKTGMGRDCLRVKRLA